MVTDWWQSRKDELLAMAGRKSPLYVFNEEILNETLFDLLSIDAIDRLFYPLRANSHPKILRKAFELDVGFTCTSSDALDGLMEKLPKLAPERILFFPDNASGEDFERAFHGGVNVVVNDLNTLKAWPGIFRNRDIFISRDVGHEQGGNGLMETSIKGFYLCPTIDSPPLWDIDETTVFLDESLIRFSQGSILILRNGMSVGVDHENVIMDIPALADYLYAIKDGCPQAILWLEVPDMILSSAGVLIATVIETCEEAGIRYIRINMDMEGPDYDGLLMSHQIINLSKPDNEIAEEQSAIENTSIMASEISAMISKINQANPVDSSKTEE